MKPSSSDSPRRVLSAGADDAALAAAVRARGQNVQLNRRPNCSYPNRIDRARSPLQRLELVARHQIPAGRTRLDESDELCFVSFGIFSSRDRLERTIEPAS